MTVRVSVARNGNMGGRDVVSVETSRSRDGLGDIGLRSRFGLGSEGLVHIPERRYGLRLEGPKVEAESRELGGVLEIPVRHSEEPPFRRATKNMV